MRDRTDELADAAVVRFDPADVVFQRRKADSPAALIDVFWIFQQRRAKPPILLPQIVVPYTWMFRSTSATRSHQGRHLPRLGLPSHSGVFEQRQAAT